MLWFIVGFVAGVLVGAQSPKFIGKIKDWVKGKAQEVKDAVD